MKDKIVGFFTSILCYFGLHYVQEAQLHYSRYYCINCRKWITN